MPWTPFRNLYSRVALFFSSWTNEDSRTTHQGLTYICSEFLQFQLKGLAVLGLLFVHRFQLRLILLRFLFGVQLTVGEVVTCIVVSFGPVVAHADLGRYFTEISRGIGAFWLVRTVRWSILDGRIWHWGYRNGGY